MYTPPLGHAVDFTLDARSYTAPTGNAVNFELQEVSANQSMAGSASQEQSASAQLAVLHLAVAGKARQEHSAYARPKYFWLLPSGHAAQQQAAIAKLAYVHFSVSGTAYQVQTLTGLARLPILLGVATQQQTATAKLGYKAAFVQAKAYQAQIAHAAAAYDALPVRGFATQQQFASCDASLTLAPAVGIASQAQRANAILKRYVAAAPARQEQYALAKPALKVSRAVAGRIFQEQRASLKAQLWQWAVQGKARQEHQAIAKAYLTKTPVAGWGAQQQQAIGPGFLRVLRPQARASQEQKARATLAFDMPPQFISTPPTAATYPFLYRYHIDARDREGYATVSPVVLPSWLSYANGVLSGIPPDPLHALPSYYCIMQAVDSLGYFVTQEWGINTMSVYENPPPNASMLRWLSQPYAGWLITVSMRGYNLTSRAEDEFYFASGEFRSAGDDNPPHRPFLEYLLDIPVFESSVSVNFEGADATWGSLSLFNKDLNYLINNYAFDYRNITIKIGDPTWKYNDFYTLFSGSIGGTGLSVDGNKINIPLRNNAALLNKKLLDASVTGNIFPKFLSDGITPHPAAEQLIPEVWGGTHEHPVFNVKPVLIEPGQQIYQVHHGRIAEIVEVTDMGDKLTYNPDPTLSQYTVNLEEGTITLKNNGARDVRCKVVGGMIAQGNTWVQPNTAADLVKMLAGRAGIDSNAILHSAFDQLNGSDPSVIGFVVNDETKIIDLVKPILNSVNSIHEFDPDGKLIVRKFVAPKAAYEKNGVYNPLYTVTSDDVDVHGVQIKEVIPPLKSYTLRYNHNHNVLSQVDDRIALEYPSVQAELKQEWCETVALNAQNANIGAYLSAQTSEKINTLLIRRSDAEFYAGVCMAYRAFPRLLVECEIISDKAAAFRCADHIAFALDNNEFNVNQKRFVISKVSREPLARKTTIQAVEIQSE